jgi:hypothetical protein
MVKAAWFRSYAANERPDQFDRMVQSWDTANKASELNPHPNPPPHALIYAHFSVRHGRCRRLRIW